MKDVSQELDPDTHKQMEKFRKVGPHLALAKGWSSSLPQLESSDPVEGFTSSSDLQIVLFFDSRKHIVTFWFFN